MQNSDPGGREATTVVVGVRILDPHLHEAIVSGLRAGGAEVAELVPESSLAPADVAPNVTIVEAGDGAHGTLSAAAKPFPRPHVLLLSSRELQMPPAVFLLPTPTEEIVRLALRIGLHASRQA